MKTSISNKSGKTLQEKKKEVFKSERKRRRIQVSQGSVDLSVPERRMQSIRDKKNYRNPAQNIKQPVIEIAEDIDRQMKENTDKRPLISRILFVIFAGITGFLLLHILIILIIGGSIL